MKPAWLLTTLLALSSLAAARVDPSGFRDLSFRQHPGAQLPVTAQFTDEAGRAVTVAKVIGGRPTILVLEYLRCQNLCSLVMSGAVASLKQARLTPGKDVSFVAISIDPRDTSREAAMARAKYARQFQDRATAAAGMHFLTGSPQQVAKIASVVGFRYRYDEASRQFLHPAGFVVITPEGRVSRYMLGLYPRPLALRAAVTEAGEGVVEPPAHPLLLLCFGYDPDEGTAAALAMRLVRWATLAIILGCALLILRLSPRRKPA